VTRLPLLALAPLALAAACQAQPAPPAPAPTMAPGATPPAVPAAVPAPDFGGGTVVPDGRARTVALPPGKPVTLTPVRIRAEGPGVSYRCGLRIGGQTLVTIGTGDTEAYGCSGLVDAGALTAKGGARRIGLLYDVSSPNAEFRTALVLVEGSGGWAVDPESVGKWDDAPAARSLAALRKAAR
jgi:hypothetical protein